MYTSPSVGPSSLVPYMGAPGGAAAKTWMPLGGGGALQGAAGMAAMVDAAAAAAAVREEGKRAHPQAYLHRPIVMQGEEGV